MKKLLITAFEPFGGESVNSALLAVGLLPAAVGDWELVRLTLPVVYSRAAETVIHAAKASGAEAILCIGQAAGHTSVTPETVAVNVRKNTVPDNCGSVYSGEAIDPGGADTYYSTLPAEKMTDAIHALGIPSEVSHSAGTFVCNDTLYLLLRRFHNTPVRVGFIHVPRSPAQGEPYMDTSTAALAIAAAIGCL